MPQRPAPAKFVFLDFVQSVAGVDSAIVKPVLLAASK
jgi:hypothetical protein